MPGLYSGDPIESPGVEAQGTYQVPATTGQVVGAALSEAASNAITPSFLRMGGHAQPGDAPEFPAVRPVISPDEANQKYSIKGPTPETSLSFSSPVPDDVARSQYDHINAEAVRQDTLSRAQPGFLTGAPAQMVYGLAGGLADPLNLAIGLLPGLGEANEARIAAAAGGGFLGRTAARVVSGAVAGATQAAALEPAQYAIDQETGRPWSMGQAMRDIAYGTALGGGLHVVGGTVADAFGRETPTEPVPNAIDSLSAEGRQTLLRGALAQAMDDKPVDQEPTLRLLQSTEAGEELSGWAAQQDRINNDADAALKQSEVAAPPDLSAQVADLQGRLGDLRDQSAALRGDLGQAQEQTARAAMDPVTTERLASVEEELSGVIPAARRAELEAQRTMLLEGRGNLDVRASGDLDVARGEAEQAGLSAAAGRIDTQAATLETNLQALLDKDAAAKTAAANARALAGKQLAIQSARIASREAVVHSLAARTIRRFAGRNGITLADGEADALAQRILRGGEDPHAVLAELAGRKMGPPTAEEAGGMAGVVHDASQPLRDQATDAESSVIAASRATSGDAAPSKAADEAMKSPPPTKVSDALARVQSDTAEIEGRMFPEKLKVEGEAAPAEPVEPEPRPPEIEAAQALVDQAERRARVADAVAACPGVIGA